MLFGAVGAVLIAAVVGVMLVTGGRPATVTSANSGVNGSYQNGASSGGGSDADEGWSNPGYGDTSPAPIRLPVGAVVCSQSASGRYSQSARGNDVTSCPFADAVRDAVRSSSGSFPRTVTAHSPVTHKTYSMQCTGDQLVTCRGGNDAIVYVY
jgi:hypothetical protein